MKHGIFSINADGVVHQGKGEFTINQLFVYNLRVTYKPYVDVQDIIQEYEQWEYGSPVIYD